MTFWGNLRWGPILNPKTLRTICFEVTGLRGHYHIGDVVYWKIRSDLINLHHSNRKRLIILHVIFSSGLPRNISQVLCIFSVFSRALIKWLWIPRKYKWQVGYPWCTTRERCIISPLHQAVDNKVAPSMWYTRSARVAVIELNLSKSGIILRTSRIHKVYITHSQNKQM